MSSFNDKYAELSKFSVDKVQTYEPKNDGTEKQN